MNFWKINNNYFWQSFFLKRFHFRFSARKGHAVLQRPIYTYIKLRREEGPKDPWLYLSRTISIQFLFAKHTFREWLNINGWPLLDEIACVCIIKFNLAIGRTDLSARRFSAFFFSQRCKRSFSPLCFHHSESSMTTCAFLYIAQVATDLSSPDTPSYVWPFSSDCFNIRLWRRYVSINFLAGFSGLLAYSRGECWDTPDNTWKCRGCEQTPPLVIVIQEHS